MNARLLLLVSVICTGLVAVPGFTLPAHASRPGLVCLADLGFVSSTPSNICPGPSLPVFDGPLTSPIQQIRIGVFVNGSEGFAGFDIALKVNSSVLKPAGVDLSGSILSGSRVTLLECLGSFNVTGLYCGPPIDTSDTLRIAVATLGTSTPTPSTGLLFTAIYNITSSTASSAVSSGFQSGCPSSSVAGTSVCVTFASGVSVVPVPETVQGASFNNTVPPPFLTISSDSRTVRPIIVGEVGGLRLNLTGQNNWGLICSPCPVALSTVASNGLKVSLNSTSVEVPSSGSAFVSMNVTGTLIGNFSATVFAQYSTLDLQSLNTDTLVASITIQVVVSDFALSASPVTVPVLANSVSSSLVSITGENGFSGTVSLSVSQPGQCSFSLSSLLVTGSAGLTLNCSFVSAGNLSVTVTGRSGPVSHTVQIGFSVQDFAVSTDSSSVTLLTGSNGTLILSVFGLNGFDQLVSVSILPLHGLTVTPRATMFAASGTVRLSLMSDAVGVYNVTVTVRAGTLSHSVFVVVKVTAPSGSSTIFGLSSVLFYSILAALGVFIATAVVFVVHRWRGHKVSRLRVGRFSQWNN